MFVSVVSGCTMAGSEGGILPSMICFESEQGETQPVSSLQRSVVAPLPSAENDRGYDKLAMIN